MYNIKFENYVPKPSPAKSDRIVAAHYYAAWKKGAAGLHEGFDDLADIYPDRTPLMGYYDEENPEVCDWEIKWALEHGINCFIYCWYRYDWNMGKPVTADALRCAVNALPAALAPDTLLLVIPGHRIVSPQIVKQLHDFYCSNNLKLAGILDLSSYTF